MLLKEFHLFFQDPKKNTCQLFIKIFLSLFIIIKEGYEYKFLINFVKKRKSKANKPTKLLFFNFSRSIHKINMPCDLSSEDIIKKSMN